MRSLGRNGGVRRVETADRTAISKPCRTWKASTTNHVEREFLTVRQELKRFEPKTLGYNKSLEVRKLAVALHFRVYNFVLQHHTLGTTPTVAAVLEKPRSLEKLVEMTEAYWRKRRDGESQSCGSGSPGDQRPFSRPSRRQSQGRM